MGLSRRVVGLLVVVLWCGGCSQMLAERMVQAPNLSRIDLKGDAKPKRLAELAVDRQLRVPVGPPDATISVYVIEPSCESWTVRGGKLLPTVVHRKPTTAPTTAPIAIKGTIFLLHGILDHKELAPYVIYREMLTRAGYRVVQVDFRGHGRSTGEFITFGAVEARDLVQVLDALEREGLVAGQVGAVGVSYGAAVGIQWSAIDARVKAVVAVQPFCTLRDVAHDAAPFVLGPGRILFSDRDIQQTINRAGEIAGFDPDDASPLQAIARTRAPVLLIHSRTDSLIPWQHSQRLHDAANDHSKLILLDGPSHFNLWVKSAELIRAKSLAWFGKYVADEKDSLEMNEMLVKDPRPIPLRPMRIVTN